MNLNKYLSEEIEKKGGMFPVVPRIECADGFSISVQSHKGAYCDPRDGSGPWSGVECGYPSSEPTEILSYAENSGDPTNTVYGYVPIEIVEKMIENHGGQKAGAV